MKKSSSAFTIFISLLLFLSFSSPLSAKKQKCHPNDKNVLLEIKEAFGNPDHLASWDPNVDCCKWDHLRCDINPPYHINLLLISEANISGQIPAAIGNLQSLEILVLFRLTNLTGTIPPSIANLPNLTNLVLSYNSLSGPIPTFLTKLKKLAYLVLSGNGFTGSIPPEFSQVQNLGSLYLDRNKLVGPIPESFGHFTKKISEIYLNDNYLSGTLPKSFGNLNLSVLHLSGNKLRGDASVFFGKNKTVQLLDLARNNFAFDFSKLELPDSLNSLDISHNKIFGSIPQQLTQSNIQYLNVSYNRLCGEIPQAGNQLQGFDVSSCSHNRCLCGAPLPACK